MFRYLLFLFGVLLALPILAVIALSLGLPITLSGVGYLLGGALAAAGLILTPWTSRNSFSITIIGILILALVAGVRWFVAGQQTNPSIRMVALPQNKTTLWINHMIDEQDSLIVGERLLNLIGGDSPHEHRGLAAALHTDYSEIRSVQRVFPSPIVSTYLNLEGTNRFDAIIIQADIHRPPEFALVFLHGYMGNVTAQCWEIAQAVLRFDAMTICPSTDWQGDWWQPQGKGILQATFQYLREQGIQRFYLGGFSNGGISLGRLASPLKDEPGLSGLIFIDGFADGAGVREIGLPVLVVQGLQDERIPAPGARQFVQELGDLATYVEMEGDHFLIMKEPKSVQIAIAKWLATIETKH
jgi:pimeloyl-ACP methyl ester carboxylesterase